MPVFSNVLIPKQGQTSVYRVQPGESKVGSTGGCNLNSQEKSKRVCIFTMSIFLIGGLNVR